MTTTVRIASSCTDELAAQFIEGTVTYARVCDVCNALLFFYTTAPVTAIVKVDGAKVSHSFVEAAEIYTFVLSRLLPNKENSRCGFLSKLLGRVSKSCGFGSESSVPSASQAMPISAIALLFPAFTLEIRQGFDECGLLLATYKYQLLDAVSFDQRFNACVSSHSLPEVCSVFTRDHRPVSAVESTTLCTVCGGTIGDELVGCENADCLALRQLAGPVSLDQAGKDITCREMLNE